MIESDAKDVIDSIKGVLFYGSPKSRFRGISIDSRSLKAGELFFCIRGKRFDGHDFLPAVLEAGAAGIVFSERSKLPDFKVWEGEIPFAIQVKDVVAAMEDYASHYLKRVDPRVVAITGTNGKSSTKEMTAAIAETRYRTHKTHGNFNNNIGLPLTIFGLEAEHRVAVLEMGMSAAGEIRRLAEIAEPGIGIITNISEAHLVSLKNVKEVQMAKGELFDALGEDTSAIVNADDPLVLELARTVRARVVTYAIDTAADIRAVEIRERHDGGYDFMVRLFDREVSMAISLPGRFNVSNALAAIAAGYLLGVPAEDMSRGLMNVRLPDKRMEVKERDGLLIVDDSYNANPRSMAEALLALAEFPVSGRRFFVVGDMLELGEISESAHRELGREVARAGVDFFLTVGGLGSLSVEAAVDEGMELARAITCIDHAEAGERLASLVKNGDCLLFKGSRGSRMEKALDELIKARGR